MTVHILVTLPKGETSCNHLAKKNEITSSRALVLPTSTGPISIIQMLSKCHPSFRDQSAYHWWYWLWTHNYSDISNYWPTTTLLGLQKIIASKYGIHVWPLMHSNLWILLLYNHGMWQMAYKCTCILVRHFNCLAPTILSIKLAFVYVLHESM